VYLPLLYFRRTGLDITRRNTAVSQYISNPAASNGYAVL